MDKDRTREVIAKIDLKLPTIDNNTKQQIDLISEARNELLKLKDEYNKLQTFYGEDLGNIIHWAEQFGYDQKLDGSIHEFLKVLSMKFKPLQFLMDKLTEEIKRGIVSKDEITIKMSDIQSEHLTKE